MDGRQLTQFVLDALDEEVASELFAKQRLIYDYLDMAAAIFARETRYLKSYAEITTVADQQIYDLPPDFIGLYMMSRRGRYFIRYYDGSNYTWPVKSTYEKIFKSNETTAKSSPNRFCILDDASYEWAFIYLGTEALEEIVTETDEDYIILEGMDRGLITGTADATYGHEDGESWLYDADQTFASDHKVFSRDLVRNMTDKSKGRVIYRADDHRLATSLAEGDQNQWNEGDEYVIIPTTHSRLMLDAPSQSSGHIIKIPYTCMPAPVFSDNTFWRFPARVTMAICQEAAFLYQNQKGDFKAADRLHQLFLQEIQRFRYGLAQQRLQDGRYRQRL